MAPVCKECTRARVRAYAAANRDKASAARTLSKRKARRSAGSMPLAFIRYRKARRILSGRLKRAALWRPRERDQRSAAERYRHRYRNDAAFAAKERMRRQIRKAATNDGIAELIRGAIRRGGASSSVEAALGYSIADLCEHLERQFSRGMDWGAFRNGDIHIDHIIPKAAFNLADPIEWRRCWSLSNLQPLWARDNLAKGARVERLI